MAFRALMKDAPVTPLPSSLFDAKREHDVTIGIALDEAFNFYYADLFDILNTFGASYVPFSPVHDRLPEADGYIIGGGYPELFAGELEKNNRMREAILGNFPERDPALCRMRRSDVPDRTDTDAQGLARSAAGRNICHVRCLFR